MNNNEIRHEPISPSDDEVLTYGVFRKELKAEIARSLSAAFLEFGEIMMRGFEALEERMNKKFLEVHARIDAVDKKLTERIDRVETSLTARIERITLTTTRREEHIKLKKRVDNVENILDVSNDTD